MGLPRELPLHRGRKVLSLGQVTHHMRIPGLIIFTALRSTIIMYTLIIVPRIHRSPGIIIFTSNKGIGEVFPEKHPTASRLVSGNDLNRIRKSSSKIPNSKATVP